jgi:hypothetical protein
MPMQPLGVRVRARIVRTNGHVQVVDNRLNFFRGSNDSDSTSQELSVLQSWLKSRR